MLYSIILCNTITLPYFDQQGHSIHLQTWLGLEQALWPCPICRKCSSGSMWSLGLLCSLFPLLMPLLISILAAQFWMFTQTCQCYFSSWEFGAKINSKLETPHCHVVYSVFLDREHKQACHSVFNCCMSSRISLSRLQINYKVRNEHQWVSECRIKVLSSRLMDIGTQSRDSPELNTPHTCLTAAIYLLVFIIKMYYVWLQCIILSI